MDKKLRTLAIGEVLWDIVEGAYHLGGAPFNVTAHLVKMGHRAAIYTSIGDDKLGHKILREMEALNVDTAYVHVHESLPTGTVTVRLQNGQPEYKIHEDVAWDDLLFDKTIGSELEAAAWDVVIFGMLCQREDENAQKIHQIIRSCAAPNLFLDVNIRKDYYTAEKLYDSLSMATIVKMNEDELKLIRDLFYPRETETRFAAEKITAKFGLDCLIITLGEKGAWAFASKKWYKASSKPVEVADAIGAGDSFSAAFLHAYLLKRDVQEALELAVHVGAYVASQSGAIPVYPESLKRSLTLS